MNQFGSDGDGKACKNSRVMAVLGPEDTSPEAELMILEASATAIKRFEGFVGTAHKLHGMPPYGVVVSVGFNEDVTYSSLTFSDIQVNEHVGEHMLRRAEAADLLSIEPDVTEAKKPVTKKAPVRRRRAA
jgi:hypothetical protein